MLVSVTEAEIGGVIIFKFFDLGVLLTYIEPEREREFSAERSKNGKREQSRKKRDCSRFFRD